MGIEMKNVEIKKNEIAKKQGHASREKQMAEMTCSKSNGCHLNYKWI